MDHIAGSLRTLLTNLVDYAGLYPPAALPLPEVVRNYERYRASPQAWILNRLVLPKAMIGEVNPAGDWGVTLLVDGEPGPLPPQVETLEGKLAAKLSLPTYCEVPIEMIDGAFAKIRTGGLVPDAIPTSEAVARFLRKAAERRLPFKATAGLHHPIRAVRNLTYEPDGPSAVMHGFINFFLAAAFAWQGAADERRLAEVLDETNARAFVFLDAGLQWRGERISTAEIATARREFAHSFGSCSFEEPVNELRELGWLP